MNIWIKSEIKCRADRYELSNLYELNLCIDKSRKKNLFLLQILQMTQTTFAIC